MDFLRYLKVILGPSYSLVPVVDAHKDSMELLIREVRVQNPHKRSYALQADTEIRFNISNVQR